MPKGQVIKEPEIYECHQMRAHERSKHGVLLEVHNLNRMRNGVTSATVRNPQESQNCILQQQCHYGDISLAAPTTEVYGTQKQQVSLRLLVVNGIRIPCSQGIRNS